MSVASRRFSGETAVTQANPETSPRARTYVKWTPEDLRFLRGSRQFCVRPTPLGVGRRLDQRAPRGGLAASGLDLRIKALPSAPPVKSDSDLAPLLPGRSILAIRSKRRRLPKVSPVVGGMVPASQEVSGEEEDTTEAQLPNDVLLSTSTAIDFRFGVTEQGRAGPGQSRRIFIAGLVADRSFFDEDFLRKWKPVFERECFANLAGDDSGAPLIALIFVSDVTSVLASMKESSPGPDGLRLHILWDIPVEVITLLCNLQLLKGPPPSRGKPVNIYTSRVTFIKKMEVPDDPLEFRPIAVENYFVRVFHRVLKHPRRIIKTKSSFSVLTGLLTMTLSFMRPSPKPVSSRPSNLKYLKYRHFRRFLAHPVKKVTGGALTLTLTLFACALSSGQPASQATCGKCILLSGMR
ncbi:unnamed protein product [Acanthosepion pharaonis]|uniref:Uncharacterized protein n=1 Tax=Acanthosepion pharaonis TaxID=158019 RepID=A0A812DLJ9_ACAPH|nr:unnamed protein product [Sepia pharaonis]